METCACIRENTLNCDERCFCDLNHTGSRRKSVFNADILVQNTVRLVAILAAMATERIFLPFG